MESDKVSYERVILVCCNERDEGQKCCNSSGGSDIRQKLKDLVKEFKLQRSVIIVKTGCMGECSTGVNIMIYPEQDWLSGCTIKDTAYISQMYIEPLKK